MRILIYVCVGKIDQQHFYCTFTFLHLVFINLKIKNISFIYEKKIKYESESCLLNNRPCFNTSDTERIDDIFAFDIKSSQYYHKPPILSRPKNLPFCTSIFSIQIALNSALNSLCHAFVVKSVVLKHQRPQVRCNAKKYFDVIDHFCGRRTDVYFSLE